MKMIGLDTSTETGGVALLEGTRVAAEYTLSLQRSFHSERLLPAVDLVLQEAGWSARRPPVEGIAVAVGPGSFTGLRIGVVTAKALAYVWDVPVVGVSTLEALAYQAAGGARIVCPLLDARNGNVYSAAFDLAGHGPRAVLPPKLRAVSELLADLEALFSAPPDVSTGDGRAGEGGAGPGEGIGQSGDDGPIVFIGGGTLVYWDKIKQNVGRRAAKVPAEFHQLRSSAVAALGREKLLRGEQDDPMGLAPVYLRKSEAERKWEQRASKSTHS